MSATQTEILDKISSMTVLELSELITMGDGSNDIPMLEAAGLSIAWHAKPKVRPHAKQAFDFAPLSGVLALFD